MNLIWLRPSWWHHGSDAEQCEPSRWFFKSHKLQSRCSSSEEYNNLWIRCDSSEVNIVVDLVSCKFWSIRCGSLAVVHARFEGDNPLRISPLLHQKHRRRLPERNEEYKKEKGKESYDGVGHEACTINKSCSSNSILSYMLLFIVSYWRYKSLISP